MNKKLKQNHDGFDFILKSIYTAFSIPDAPLPSMRNPAGFSFFKQLAVFIQKSFHPLLSFQNIFS